MSVSIGHKGPITTGESEFEPGEWVAMRKVSDALRVLVEEEKYSIIDTVGDALKPELRVEALRRGLRMVASMNPERLPSDLDVEVVVKLLMDEKRGKLAGSIISTLALSKKFKKEQGDGEQ